MSGRPATDDDAALLHVLDANVSAMELDPRSVRVAIRDAFLRYG